MSNHSAPGGLCRPVAIFLALGLCLALAPALALADANRDLLATLRASGLPQDSFSLLAIEVDGSPPRTLLSVNPASARNPASVTKLVTAAVVLREIPVGTRFETRLLSDAPLADAVLEGDLILQGGGDPAFVSETLWLLVNRLAQAGVRSVTGDIVVDDSYFDAILIDQSRDTRRSEQAYDAPVSAMSFNWNSANVMIRPGPAIGAPARVLVDPPSGYLRIDNTATTVAGASIAHLRASRHPALDAAGDVLVVSGNIGIRANGFDTHRNISFPALWSGANLRLYLGYLGIEVAGQVRRGSAPAGARTLASVEGRPV